MSEVTLVDLGGLLKVVFANLGCFAIFWVIIFVVDTATAGAGFGNWSVINWIIWPLILWGIVYEYMSDRSYHEWKVGWYFPKLNWLGSLILSAYLTGFAYILKQVLGMELGLARDIASAAFFVVYACPFILFLSLLSIGHSKLMEKRRAAAE